MDDVLDLAALRADTPGCAERVHLNNAGAGLMPAQVIEAIKGHIDLEARIGGYEAAALRSEACEAAYNSVAALVGAQRSEIAFVGNATLAWQAAFYCQELAPGDRILTSRAEYAANYVAYLQVAKRSGCVIEVIPDRPDGATDPEALERMIDERAKLVSITWIPTNGGLINPAAEVGRIARAHGVTYLLDACQAVGQVPVDVEELGCDFLTATGRKFLRGPRGIGFLYVRRALLESIEPAMLDHFAAPWTATDAYELRPDAGRFETWEKPWALVLGLGAAADYALKLGSEVTMARAFALADTLRRELGRVAGVSVCDLGTDKCAIVSFTHQDFPAGDVVRRLREADVNLSVSRPSSTLLDSQARHLPDLVRASPHYYNSEDELDAFLRDVRALR